MRQPASLILTAALMATSAVAQAGATPPATKRFEPAPCAFKDVPAGWPTEHHIDCGWLRVAESRGNPRSRSLRLWVAIARADGPSKRNDPLLYLHGGPGLSTVDYVFPRFPTSKTWPSFRRDRDIVFFDQRGTGRSQPAFCPELQQTMQRLALESPRADKALAQREHAFAECRVAMLATGLDFAAYNSVATVEDAEDLRRALAVPQWNLYGISYGTRVGLEYLRQHPQQVRSAVLDSVFPPNSPHSAAQIGVTAQAYHALQRACDAQAGCATRFPDLLGAMAKTAQRLDAAPMARTGGRIDGGAWASALWSMLVSSKTAPWVPLALEHGARGDEAAIRRIVEIFGGDGSFGDYSHGQAMSVNCYEATTGSTADTRRDLIRRYPQLVSAGERPEETDRLCAAWQTEHAPMTQYAPVASDVPVLLYAGEFDPATPFDDALLAGRYLTRSTLVSVRGASHAAFYEDDCTRGIARNFYDQPQRVPDLACLAQRPATVFPTEGLDDFLKSM